MESLYFNQTEIAESIRKTLVNFKKDSVERKTIDYCKRRLELLETYWNDFQNNHEKLSSFERTNHKYFVQLEYERTKEAYLAAKNVMTEFYENLIQQREQARKIQPKDTFGEPAASVSSHSDQQDQLPPTSAANTFQSKGTNSQLDDMLHKQLVNFKAFKKAVINIDINSIVERWELEDSLRILQNRWTIIENLHWEIISVLDENEAYESQFNIHEQTFISMKKSINTKIWSSAHQTQSTPQMDIPIFTGNYHQWVSFKDLFDEVIHKNPSLSNAQKMQFLKSKVKGEAERLVQHLPISSENYIVCREILHHRFDNKKLIFSAHVNMFINLPTIQQQTFQAIKKLHDVTFESLHAIKNLGVDTTTWDPLIVHILSQKLDSESYSEYIESLKNTRELPILKDFLDFLENKFTSLESSRRRSENIPKQQSYQLQNSPPTSSFTNNRKPHYNKAYDNRWKNTKYIAKSMHVAAIKCPLCVGEHALFNCGKFLAMSNDTKLQIVKQYNYCINCIYDHNGNNCRSAKRCKLCFGKHHTELHGCFIQQKPNSTSGQSKLKSNDVNRIKQQQNDGQSSHASQRDSSEILLATALVKVTSADSTQHVIRALIDGGSQISLISERAAQQLGLKRQQYRGLIYGVGEKENNCKGSLNITCQSMYSDFSINTEVLIMKNLIKNLPNRSFEQPAWSHIQHINLADPEFYLSRPIDLLLGAEIYSNIILDGIIKAPDMSLPFAQRTQLGWLLCGSVKTFHCNVVLSDIPDIQRFWKIEDIHQQEEMSTEDQECVEHYMSTTKRLDSGRYEVRIPIKQQISNKLGSSKEIAIAQFKNLEKKLSKNENLEQEYQKFMREYLELGHMKRANPNNKQLECYLNQLSVLRESSTTKLRVVFNASGRTSTGYSLNDITHKGPNLQQDLQELLIKWRQYRYAYTADIEKMYRQILVNEEDQKLQQIVWRNHVNQPIRFYQLTTVTYGQKSAPFLAMMTLHQLANDEQHNYPNAAKSLREDFFMDDLVSGAHSIEEGKSRIAELNSCLGSGGFLLRKWSANEQTLLEDIRLSQQAQSSAFIFKTENIDKTLGLRWDPTLDEISFQYKYLTSSAKLTKRMLLSEISKIFDPLGWLAPLTTKMKLIFQKVWLNSELQWGDEVPNDIKTEWLKLKEDLDCISQYRIPRWLSSHLDEVIEIHSFSDTSISCYAAVSYARIKKGSKISVVLIAAKSRLVPHGRTVTLPRLELCAAELLSKLVTKILSSLSSVSFKIELYGWSDSKVTLSWIQGNPDRWKPFVSHRVKKIINVIPACNWHYVASKENPADSASRGITPSDLKSHTLWWQGPAWLSSIEYKPKQHELSYFTDEELRKQVTVVQENNSKNSVIEDLLNQHSSFIKIKRILAWLLRAFVPVRKQMPPYITLQELRRTKLLIIKHIQSIEFSADINNLSLNKTLRCNSKILNLNPFLDKNGILRVGGRLKNANISSDMKYPIIIPYNSRLTELLIDEAHQLTFHGGARLTLSLLRHNYWIIKGNRATKKRLRICVTCRKQDPRKVQQIMGDLPDFRTNPAPPFYHTGVDYTGFIKVKANKGRGIKTTKGYIALFLCMVTKAVHIELVSDLSSFSFIAALHRLAARRGAPKHIYSDNGTNFIGANKILQNEYKELQNVFSDTFYKEITEMEIQWHWNCPSFPSAGGIWERSIRSIKQHLKRVIGEQALTFEEYSTLLARIEASLNSRPLCPLSEDIEDVDFLTPGHFLTSNIGTTVIETTQDARTRWYLVNKTFHDIWKRWKTEYLTQLSVRSKWLKGRQSIEIGDLVTIHDDNLPAGKWPVGRITELHPGKDGVVRVVTLKTKNGYIKRPVLKLSILPIEKRDENIPDSVNSKKSNCQPKLINWVLSLILFLSVVMPAQAFYQFKQFDSNNTLYLDPLGEVHLIRDEWRIVMYYNMSPFWKGDTIVAETSNYLEQTCSKIQNKSHCHVITLQLQHEYNELQYYNQLLLNQHFDVRSRTRRGLINAVGSIANSLFGVLDQEFAEKYRHDIELVHENIDHLSRLWKNQTSVIEAEYNILQRMENTIDKQHKLIHKHLNYLDRITNELQKEINIISVQQDFTLAALATINMIQNLKRIQDTFLDTITDIYNGHINLHLLTPKQLRAELQIISGQISKELALPVDDIPRTVNTLKSLHIHVPKAVLTGEDAELMCSYELEGAQLYSIRWYRNMIEFYRYVPKESPATKVFPVAEIKVDVAASDQNRVVLTEVDKTLTGEYQCEVSADAPLFHTDIKSAEMVVVEPPLTSPNVTSDRLSYVGGDHIRVNCSSPPSLPAANITWYVNEQMVPGFTANHVLNFSNGYASSLATLELEAAQHSPVPTLMIRCEASIFNVWRSTSHTILLRERSSNPASALGRSLTGGATETCLPTIMVLFFIQLLLQRYSGTSIR